MQERETSRAELEITAEDARAVAGLLRYAVSLNTTAGLVSPTQRRLATSTYRAVELAAGVLEGKALEEAIRDECGKRDANRFEPSAAKGIVARATLYFLLRYPGISASPTMRSGWRLF